ncbi:hypothetical protein Tco_0783142 [Tanacetum coccineum]
MLNNVTPPDTYSVQAPSGGVTERITHAQETYAPPHKVLNLHLIVIFLVRFQNSFKKKSIVDESSTLGSTEAVDNVNIFRSCNGLLIAIYWNDAFHWLETENRQLTHYKLNVEDHDHPIITTMQIPQVLQQGRNFFESYGNILPMIITIQIPHMLHLEGKLFESRRCLLLIRRDYIGFREFTIYEMRKMCSLWSIKYLVDTDDFITPLPEGWSIRSTV